MFSLDELLRAEAVVRAALPPTPAIAWPLIARRLGAEVVVKHENHTPTGAFKVRGGLTFVDALKRREPDATGVDLGDARQPRPEPRLRRRARRARGAHLRPARQLDREERGDARARRRARSSTATTSRRRARKRCGSPPNAAAHRRARPSIATSSLGVSTYALELFGDAPRPRRPLRADRPGFGHLRLHRGARRARAEDRDRRRAVERMRRLTLLSFAAGRAIAHRTAATRSPTAWRRGSRRRGARDHPARRVAHRAGRRRRDRRRDPRLLDRHAQSRRRRRRGAARRRAAGAPRLAGKQVGLILSGGNIDLELFQRWAAPAVRPAPTPPVFAPATARRHEGYDVMNKPETSPNPISACRPIPRRSANRTSRATRCPCWSTTSPACSRAWSACSRRARFNIESLTVAEVAHETHQSRITIVTSGTIEVVEQVRHQLERLVPIHSVTDLTETNRAIERELAMVKVRGKGDNRGSRRCSSPRRSAPR